MTASALALASGRASASARIADTSRRARATWSISADASRATVRAVGAAARMAPSSAPVPAPTSTTRSVPLSSRPDETGGGRQDHPAPERLVGIDAPVVAVGNVGKPWPARISLVRHDGIFRAVRLTARLVLGR